MSLTARHASLALTLLASACGSTTVPAADATAPRDVTTDAATPSPDVSDASVDVRDATSDVSQPRCPGGVAMPYPEAPDEVTELSAVPDMTFETASGTLSLHDWYAPCAATPKLLVIRTLAAWSGPSQYAAEHTRRVLSLPQGDRIELVDLVALGPDNTAATVADLAAWRQRYDAPPTALAIDPEYRFRSLYFNAGEVPLYAFIDTRTMRLVGALMRPSGVDVTNIVARALANIDGLPRPSRATAPLIDGRFTPEDWEMIQAMRPLGAPPPDPTNRVADDPRAAAFGETLFNDAGFSSNGMISCASCHSASTLYADARPQGVGLARGDRNTPTVLLAPHARWIFHDGRVDTLWAQALGPPENPIEMGFTRLQAAHRIAESYATQYTALFGALPALDNAARFPARGMPGDEAWRAMTEADRDAVNRVYVNMGKAIAAYERTLRFPTTPFDRYVAGDMTALTSSQRDGLRHFFVNGCAQCHHGPTLSDDSFHNVGMPTGHRDGSPDRGRVDAIETLVGSPFRSDGIYSDDRTPGAHLARIVADPSTLGQFHTPTLRGVSRTGPWGHGGTFTTLASVVRLYAMGLMQTPIAGTTGTLDIHLPAFHSDDGTVVPMVNLLDAM